jgi:hypothetical protein
LLPPAHSQDLAKQITSSLGLLPRSHSQNLAEYAVCTLHLLRVTLGWDSPQ